MSWKMKMDAPGGAVWMGEDSVFDMRANGRETVSGLLFVYGVLFLLFPATGLIWFTRWDILEGLTGIEEPLPKLVQSLFDLGVLALLVTIYWRLFKWWMRRKPDEWLKRSWTLRGSATGFAYQAEPFSKELNPFEIAPEGASWEVTVDEVARVEIGRTREWRPARGYPCSGLVSPDKRVVASVPEAEIQVFLYLADGSRRVVFTGNAARESAATLQQSVQSWLEAQRVKARRAEPSAVVSPGRSRPKGFDI